MLIQRAVILSPAFGSTWVMGENVVQLDTGQEAMKRGQSILSVHCLSASKSHVAIFTLPLSFVQLSTVAGFETGRMMSWALNPIDRHLIILQERHLRTPIKTRSTDGSDKQKLGTISCPVVRSIEIKRLAPSSSLILLCGLCRVYSQPSTAFIQHLYRVLVRRVGGVPIVHSDLGSHLGSHVH